MVSATPGGQAEPQVLSFGLMEIALRIVIEIFGNPELLTVFVNNAIDPRVLMT